MLGNKEKDKIVERYGNYYWEQIKKLSESYDKDIEERAREIEEKDQRIAELEKQLEEKDNLIEFGREEIRKRNKRIDEIVERDKKLLDDKNKELEKLKQQLAEKDKEIESIKQQLEETNAGYDFTYEQGTEAIKELKQNQIQLAIRELEKVKNFVDGRTYCADYINKRIQELKGE